MSQENKRLATIVLGLLLAFVIIYYSGAGAQINKYAEGTEVYQRTIAARNAYQAAPIMLQDDGIDNLDSSNESR